MCIASSATFRNWNGNCGWRSEAATGSCTNDPRTAPSGRQEPTQTGEPKMKIEVLYVPDCPHHPAVILKLKEFLAAEGVAERTAVVRHGRRLEYFTIGWNALEGLVAVVAGAIAGSISL